MPLGIQRGRLATCALASGVMGMCHASKNGPRFRPTARLMRIIHWSRRSCWLRGRSFCGKAAYSRNTFLYGSHPKAFCICAYITSAKKASPFHLSWLGLLALNSFHRLRLLASSKARSAGRALFNLS